ncbi:MAG: DNA-formamidopyrimidine glycosylase [Promethearchaeota archaeon]|jgi:formamidopyrimidine-DNA glycosylase
MPELPEVETFKRYLDKTSLKKLIKKILVTDKRILKIDEPYLKKSLIGKKFESSTRHGKYLFVHLNPRYLVMHFGMTGDLEYYNKKDDHPKYSKVIFQFNNDFNLAYISTRMFGKIDVVDSIEEFVKNKKLGLDAYKMSFEEFKEAVEKRTAIIKNAFLNQSFIAGIGNIYSDEILFRSKIHPRTKINSLSESKIKELFTNIKEVLKFGIEKQGDLSTYPNNFLIPHRKKEECCPICDTEISRFELAGRHGFFCPKCQKELK